jgi:hypothetical protein
MSSYYRLPQASIKSHCTPILTLYVARHQFGNLQHRTFPWYFNLSIVLSGGLLLLWTTGHPHVLGLLINPKVADVTQMYMLATVFAAQLVNQTVIGPLTSKYVGIYM